MYQKAKYYVFYGIFLGSCLRLAALIRQRNTHIILISWLIRASGTSFMRFSRPLKVTQHRINHQTTRQHSIFLSFRSLPLRSGPVLKFSICSFWDILFPFLSDFKVCDGSIFYPLQ